MTDALIIGYGNTLRGDDGVGPRVARKVAGWRCPGVTTREAVQLTPELAAELAVVSRVLFVDAGRDAELTVRRVQPSADPGSVAHAGDPARLLGWSLALYGRCPEAWLVTIPAEDFDYGERLSRRAGRGMCQALRWIRAWLDDDRGAPV